MRPPVIHIFPDRFFSAFSSRMNPESSLLYDITTIASYSGHSMFEFSHAKDHGDLPEINLSLVMERWRSLPILFEIYPGSIVDVSTLAITLERFRNLVPAVIIILDRGFFSLENLRLLHKHGYIVAATYSRKEVKHVFSANMKKMDSADNTIMYNDKPIFAMHVDFSIGDLSLEGYLYHDMDLEAREDRVSTGISEIPWISSGRGNQRRKGLPRSHRSDPYVENITDT